MLARLIYRLPHLGAVRADAHHHLVDHRRHGRGRARGYFGGWIDLLFQRFIEIWTSIPELYLLLILSAVLTPGFFVLLGILLLFSWVSLVGLVRAEFLRGRNFEYVQAARALGVSNFTIMFRHLLPNAMVSTMTYMPFIVSSSVMTLTALDFLGFGAARRARPRSVNCWRRARPTSRHRGSASAASSRLRSCCRS